MTSPYVLDGPADCGNVFGYFKPGFVPAGTSVVVYDTDEYANGGSGPTLFLNRSFRTREAAEAALAKWKEEHPE